MEGKNLPAWIAARSPFRRRTTTGSAQPFRRSAVRSVRIEIERATGALRIAKAYSVLECGKTLVPEVVIAQSHGGFAMG